MPPVERRRFRAAVSELFLFLITGIPQPGLRLKKLEGTDTWESTWAPDGRATFHYGDPVREGHQHIVWRRIGTHDILRDP